jgi:hypothetical protein
MAERGQGTTLTYKCILPGMPRVTNGAGEMEFVVTPATTHILIRHIDDDRRIFTDGRGWPDELDPTFLGYSSGHGSIPRDGRYDVLEVETRGPFKRPRAFDGSGLPLHADNETVVKERIYVDKADPKVAHDEVMVIDHASTRPWTVMKNYRRSANRRPQRTEENCSENNLIAVGKERRHAEVGWFADADQEGSTSLPLFQCVSGVADRRPAAQNITSLFLRPRTVSAGIAR